ncbi:MAG TPA: DUF445 domain-containing protein [Nocardioidaceae bacterium]|nr:DUF445 domain-containing protein [Nocardioidaceae bacterium]
MLSQSTTTAPEPGPAQLSPADLDRRAGLRRMRTVAVALLVLAAVVYVATLDGTGALGFVNAGAEAAMVGALADWFAVTALFRHPLGLPIPHTAIIPTRKDALGQSLRDFVTDHFLTEDVVRQKVASAEVSRRAGRWLTDDGHATLVVAESARVLRAALGHVRDEDITQFVEHALLPRLVDEPISPVAGHLLSSVVEDGAHHALVDLAVTEVHTWLTDNPTTVARVVGSRAPWWSPQWLDEKVTDRVQAEVLAWLVDVRDRPDHPARRALDDLLTQLAVDLQHDPETMARAEALKTRVLVHPDVGHTVTAVWAAVRHALLDAIDEPDGLLRRRATVALTDFGQRLLVDDLLRDRLDGYACDAVAYVARTYGREIAGVISDTVDRWNGKEAAARIELHVGRDLQFIRINGTVVGGLAGLGIHAIAVLL